MKSYFKIIRYMKPYWFIALLAPVFLSVEVVMTLLIPKTTGDIINLGIVNHDLEAVIQLSLFMLLYTFLTVVFAFLSNFFANWASAEMVNDLRIDTFKKSLNMSFTNLDEYETGKVITRVTSDTNMLRWISRSILRTIFKAPFLLFGAIFMAYKINPNLSMILVFIVPLLFISNYFIVKKSYPKYRKVQEKLENVNTITQENLENIRVVKAFDRSNYENDKFDTYIDDLMKTTIKANVFSSFNSPIFMFIMNMSIVAVLWFGGLDVINGKFLIGDITAFLGYLGQISGALSMITGLINMLPRAGASSNRILELFEIKSEIEETKKSVKDTIEGKIEFKNVSFAYKNSDKILENISFIVNPGEKLGIIGTTGSGKSTLINLISRFYDVTDGEVLIDDVNVKEYDIHTLRSQISTVMQKTLLFAGTIEDNIKFGAMNKEVEEVIEASKNAEAYEFINKFKDGYETTLGERGINLSGGQKQRLSMARSIITKPKILIFDDSTSAVDMTTESRILNSLDKNIKNTTIVIIAQRIKTVINADKIVVLENGKMTGFGTHDELLKTNKIYKDIYEAQFGGSDTDE